MARRRTERDVTVAIVAGLRGLGADTAAVVPTTGPDSGDVHIIPLAGPEHVTSELCWCAPTLDAYYPSTSRCVWVHRLVN